MSGKQEEIKTDVDVLISFVKRKKRVSFDEVAQHLKLDYKTIEAWATFLEEEGEIGIDYKFTTPYLVDRSTPVAEPSVDEGTLSFAGITTVMRRLRTLLSKGNVSEADILFHRAILECKRILEKLPLEKGNEHPFEKQEIHNTLAAVQKQQIQAREHIRSNRLDPARIVFNQMERDINDTVAKLKSLHFESKSRDTVSKVPTRQGKKYSIGDVEFLLRQAYELMTKGRFEEAKGIYKQIENAYGALPREFQEKESGIKRDMVKLNKDITVSMKETYQKQAKRTASRIKELVTLIQKEMSTGDFQTAEELLKKMDKLYSELPKDMLEAQSSIKKDMLSINEQFILKKRELLKTQDQRVLDQFSSTLASFQDTLQKGDLIECEHLIGDLKNLYQEMPKGFVFHKDQLKKKILESTEKLLEAKDRKLTSTGKQATTHIQALLREAEHQLASDDTLEKASLTLLKIEQLYNMIPPQLYEIRSDLQQRILELDSRIIDKKSVVYKQKFSVGADAIRTLLVKAEEYIKNNQATLANALFSEITQKFNDLPKGFIHVKTELHNEILSVYKDMLLQSSAGMLAQQSPEVKTQYNTLLKLILYAYDNISNGQYKTLKSTSAYMVKAYDRLPHGLVSRNHKLGEEISKIQDILELSRSVQLFHRYSDKNISFPKDKLEHLQYLISRIEHRAPQAGSLIAEARSLCSMSTSSASLAALQENLKSPHTQESSAKPVSTPLVMNQTIRHHAINELRAEAVHPAMHHTAPQQRTKPPKSVQHKQSTLLKLRDEVKVHLKEKQFGEAISKLEKIGELKGEQTVVTELIAKVKRLRLASEELSASTVEKKT